MSECGICIEKYTKMTRKKITCPSCSFESCIQCLKQFVINDTTQEAHCMNCKVRFTNEFMNTHFTKKWINSEYRNHRTTLLFTEQKSHLPDTEGYVQDVILSEKIFEEVKEIRYQINMVNQSYDEKREPLRSKIRDLEMQIQDASRQLRILSEENSKSVRPLYNMVMDKENEAYQCLNGNKNKKVEKRHFLMNCCKNDCKGFVNNKYVCGLCETIMCSKCFKEKGEDHVCNEDDVKTVEEIKRSCKNCPKCGIPTQKISGCPQMWCVECHALWNWNTGAIDNSGRIHNPHYYQFLRNGDTNTIRREQGDVLCGGDVTAIELRHAFSIDHNSSVPMTQRKSMLYVGFSIIEQLNHISEHEINKFAEAEQCVLRDLRVSYLRNKITEEEWKKELKIYEKKERKKKDYREVLGLYVASVQDLLRNSVELKILQVHAIKEMKDYANNVLEKLNKQYNVKGVKLEYINVKNTEYSRQNNISVV